MKIQKRILSVLFLLAAVGLCACAKRDSGIIQSRRGTGVKTEEAFAQEEAESLKGTEIFAPEVSGEDLYILRKLDTEQKLAVFQKAGGSKQRQYAYDTGTLFLDKYGNSKSMASFVPGDAVQIEVSGHTQHLVRMQQSDQAWVYEDIVQYSFDPDSRVLTIGQTRYACDPGMEIFSGEGTVGFDGLGEDDVLRAVGRDKELLSLSVEQGHGYLALANTKLFEGSFICIGDKIFKEVTKNMKVEVPEGTYLVTVANDGYGGSREVEIARDQTVTLNLDELKGEGPKMCRITFRVGVEGATLYIDGKKADATKPVDVRYGVHTIAVEAEGYDTIEERLVVNSAESEIEIALTEQAKSSAKTDKTDSAGQDKNGGSTENTGTNNNNGTNNGNGNNSNAGNNGTNNSGNNGNNGTNNGYYNGSSNTNGNGNYNNNQSQTDYLTTLYNLLTSINNNNNSSNNNNATSSGGTANSSYDDLRDQ